MFEEQAPESHPYFSIVIPVYNAERFVSRTIESVLAQTDQDWELILVDDCSTDETAGILAEYEKNDARIRVIRNPVNLNIARSLNRGISLAQGKWIARLDADDLFHPHYLQNIRPFTEIYATQEVFISVWVSIIDELDEKLIDVRLPEAAFIERMMKKENFLYHPGTCFPKTVWERVGGYPVEDRTIAEDKALWIRFIENSVRLIMVPECLVYYRLHDNNITSVNDAQLLKNGKEKRNKALRQNLEWKISLYLKQDMPQPARRELLHLLRLQKQWSLKNMQYLLLSYTPKRFIHFYMWQFRPYVRSMLQDWRGRRVRV